MLALVNSAEHLDCITRNRAKAPAGRRLPRQLKGRGGVVHPTTASVQHQQRSESLQDVQHRHHQQQQQQHQEPVIRLSSNVMLRQHAASNRLIHRMIEFDDSADMNTSRTSYANEGQRQADDAASVEQQEHAVAVPDYSNFDQSWFLLASASSGVARASATPSNNHGGVVAAANLVANSNNKSRNGETRPTSSSSGNRYWPCSLL